MDLNYSFYQVAPIVLLPFFAFVINAFIVKKFTKLAVFISCAAIFGSFYTVLEFLKTLFLAPTPLIITFINYLPGSISVIALRESILSIWGFILII